METYNCNVLDKILKQYIRQKDDITYNFLFYIHPLVWIPNVNVLDDEGHLDMDVITWAFIYLDGLRFYLYDFNKLFKGTHLKLTTSTFLPS